MTVQTPLPCPCCHSPAKFRKIESGEDAGGEYIECTNNLCGITTQLSWSLLEDCKPKLLEVWNRRLNSNVLDHMLAMSRDERLEIINEFCVHCGKDDPDCH